MRVFPLILILAATVALHGCDDGETTEPAPDIMTEQDSVPTPDTASDILVEDTIDDPGSPLDWDVKEWGPYQVGFREVEVTYTPAPLTQERALRVAVWYPTNTPAADPALYFGAIASEIATIDAPATGENMPILVFSHGHMGFAEATSFLCEYFASHGWISIAPDHVGNTTTDLGKAVTAETYLWRPRDLSASLDWLYQLPEEDPLSGRVGDRVALAGHSFGGWTSFVTAGASFALDSLVPGCEADAQSSQFCVNLTDDLLAVFSEGLQDERIELIIPLDPGNASMLQEGVSEIDVPVLLMTADGPPTGKEDDYVSPFWNWLTQEDAIWINITTAGHQSFGILCDIMPSFAEDEGCSDAFMPHAEVYDLINIYALAFARYHLWDDQNMASIVSGEESLSEEVKIHTRP